MNDVVEMVRKRNETEPWQLREKRRACFQAVVQAWKNIIVEVVPKREHRKYFQIAKNEAVEMVLVSADERSLHAFAEPDGTYSVEQLTAWSRRITDLMRTICGKHADKVLPS